jgi:hypothetical protein
VEYQSLVRVHSDYQNANILRRYYLRRSSRFAIIIPSRRSVTCDVCLCNSGTTLQVTSDCPAHPANYTVSQSSEAVDLDSHRDNCLGATCCRGPERLPDGVTRSIDRRGSAVKVCPCPCRETPQSGSCSHHPGKRWGPRRFEQLSAPKVVLGRIHHAQECWCRSVELCRGASSRRTRVPSTHGR